jgi:glyoxylase-like metal-dependent hydrolase (beta-lactamase superfamily II)
VKTPDGPAIVDCGPANAADELEAALEHRGVPLADLRHLLISHIHLDHAGGAGVLVRRNPSLTVHVSAIGAPHLVDPSRLERSARRIYLDRFDDLWGEIAPVPEANLAVVGDRVLGLDVFPAPGHAAHQVCYLGEDGTLYPGDALGVRISPGTFVAPYAPPPDIDLAAWHATLDEVERRRPGACSTTSTGTSPSCASGSTCGPSASAPAWASTTSSPPGSPS